jgi:hypothetical protein
VASTEQQVRAATSPQEAILVLAKALDRALQGIAEIHTNLQYGKADNAWDQIGWSEPIDHSSEWLMTAQDQAKSNDRAVEVIENGDTTDIVLRTPSEEKMQRRREFEAQHLRLSETLGDAEDWNEAYAKGGPMWLYIGNRELVMSYPEQVRSLMIEDVIEDSPKDAHEMGADLLKQPSETGPGSVAMRANDGIVNLP